MKTQERRKADDDSKHDGDGENSVVATLRVEHLNHLHKDIPERDGDDQDSGECQRRAGDQSGHGCADGHEPQAGHERGEEQQ